MSTDTHYPPFTAREERDRIGEILDTVKRIETATVPHYFQSSVRTGKGGEIIGIKVVGYISMEMQRGATSAWITIKSTNNGPTLRFSVYSGDRGITINPED